MAQDTLSLDAASIVVAGPAADTTVPQLFAEQVRRTPANVALVSDAASMRYEQLDAEACRLARYLVRSGMGREDVVAVFLERSPELIVTLLAAGMSGAAFTVLETASPADRLSFIIRDSGARLILTCGRLADRLPPVDVPRICLEDLAPRLEAERPARPDVAILPASLAAVMYTSGSTGTPKGVLIDHGSIAQHATYVRECYDIEPADAAVFFSPPNFDPTLEQVFSTLISGAALVIPPSDLWSAEQFYRAIVELGITIVNPPVAYWRSLGRGLAERAESLPPHPLKVVVIGGDAMLPEDVKAWSRTPFVTHKLIHCYGPTETTVYVANTEVPADIGGTPWERTIPIGKPVAGRRIYLLDADGAPVPDGTAGEICIGGHGLARGYFNRPAQTVQAFRPDPFSSLPGARLYRTGDLGRRLPDGNIEFLGRLDHQVKIRGYRVEPREVEQALRNFPGVSDAIVIGRTGRGAEKQLVAYLVSSGPAPEVRALQQFLAARLPAYMIPAQYVFLDALPSLPTGKIDRHALPEPPPMAASGGEAPSDRIEADLASIWREILGVPQVGRFDNFLELGGDSILALQVAARANELGYRLTYQDVFERQTIAELAEAAVVASAAAIVERPAGEVLLTPVQRMFCERGLSNPSHYNQALMLTPLRVLDPDICRVAAEHLLEQHDALRLRIACRAGHCTQRYADSVEPLPFQHVDLRSLPDDERIPRLEAHASDCQRELDLERGPIAKLVLYSIGQQQRLFFVVHHLAIDTVSWRILVEDFLRGYEQLRNGEPVSLGRKTTSFQEWSRRLHEKASTPELEREIAYWERAAADADRPFRTDGDGPNVSGSEEMISRELDEDRTATLMAASRRAGVAPSDVMICALGRTLGPWLEAGRILVDLESHGRDTMGMDGIDLTRTVGWFTVVFPFVVESADGEWPVEAVRQVRARLDDVPNNGAGYGLLRFASPNEAIVRRMRALPQSQICFNYVGQWDLARSANPLVKFASERVGRCVGAEERRPYLLDVGAVVAHRRLAVHWTYSRNVYRSETVAALADRHIAEIRVLLSHLQ